MSNTKSAESTLSEPIFNRQALVRLILPLLAEQFLSVSMGMADTLMVSGVGEAAVSSVSLVDSLNILIIQILSALATGGAVISSQYLGRRDGEKAAKSAAQLYTVLAVSTIAVMLVILVLSRPILRIVFGRIDDDVMSFSQTYFLISAISYPFIGFYNAGAALFRAQGNSRISMLASLVMNIINICFNALFIYGLGMGVLGAALATLLGRVFAAAWVFWQQQQIENPLCIRHIADMKPDGDLIRRILGIGIPSGLENGMFQIGKLCVSSLTSTLGTSAIAANAVANTISGIANIPGSTMGLAMIPVVSRCLGAGDKKTGQALRQDVYPDGNARFVLHQRLPVFYDSLHCTAVQPFGYCAQHVRYRYALVLFVQRCLLGYQLYAAQRPAQRRRCPLHHDGEHFQHVAVPRNFELHLCAQAQHGADRRVVRYVH